MTAPVNSWFLEFHLTIDTVRAKNGCRERIAEISALELFVSPQRPFSERFQALSGDWKSIRIFDMLTGASGYKRIRPKFFDYHPRIKSNCSNRAVLVWLRVFGLKTVFNYKPKSIKTNICFREPLRSDLGQLSVSRWLAASGLQNFSETSIQKLMAGELAAVGWCGLPLASIGFHYAAIGGYSLNSIQPPT